VYGNIEKILLASVCNFLGLPDPYLFVRIRILPSSSDKNLKKSFFCHLEIYGTVRAEEEQDANP
jgi:hypothetical protein